ncbi:MULTISPECIES: DUF1818 family protein [unclassified Cyanobium]|uniref:DUF1818 family protein n=1 Tax=unclassified Cyanobium TaxID=2627006 RepID=UPI00164547DB|nr:DUF1818 family protein [Cyanobium sp. NS01]MBE9154142.1 DUF1818 family protein [Cyanobium sp. LEGE 06113]
MEVLEGQGWRLVVDPCRAPWPVLIGAEGWAAELSAGEARLLASGVQELAAQLEALADQLMAEESITLELERPCGAGSLWLEIEGHRRAWALRLVLAPGPERRGIEGRWCPQGSAAIAAALEQALQGLELQAPELSASQQGPVSSCRAL